MMNFIPGTLLKPGLRIFDSWILALFPQKCVACGTLYTRHGGSSRTEPGADSPMGAILADFLCPPCGRTLISVESPMCDRCGELFDGREGPDHRCERCARATGWFTRARAVGVYGGALLSLVHAFKYKSRLQLALPFAELMWLGLNRHGSPVHADMILPIPLHPRKLRRRGFNHAFQMIKAWPHLAGRYGVDPERIVIDDRVLVRVRDTSPQTGLKRPDRLANMRHAFEVAEPGVVAGRTLLLVDDVMTTGATAEECSKVLMQNGAKRVDVLTLARA